MRKLSTLAIVVLACALLVGAGKPGKPMKPAGYDPARDPAADLKSAMTEAQRDGKRILLEVGGEWCVWCQFLNNLFTEDEESRRASMRASPSSRSTSATSRRTKSSSAISRGEELSSPLRSEE